MSFLKSGWRLISKMKDDCLVTSSVFSSTALGSWTVQPSLYFASVWNLKAKLQSQPQVCSSLSSSGWFVCALWHINMAFDLHQEPVLHTQPLGLQRFSKHSSVFLMGILVCYGSCQQGPQTEQLKITEMYCTTVLKARSPNPDVGRATLPLKLRKQSSLPLLSSGGAVPRCPSAHSSISLWCHMAPRVPPPLLSVKTSSYWIRSPPRWSHLKRITSAKILFPNKVTFTGAGGLKISTHPFQGNHSTHTSLEPCFFLRLSTLCHQVPLINPTGPKHHVICKITITILNDDLKVTLFVALGTGWQKNGYTRLVRFFLLSYLSISGYQHFIVYRFLRDAAPTTCKAMFLSSLQNPPNHSLPFSSLILYVALLVWFSFFQITLWRWFNIYNCRYLTYTA